jgi:hypothetical protein
MVSNESSQEKLSEKYIEWKRNNIRPRAIIFKAIDKDLNEIMKFIKNNFSNLEIVYVTTGSPTSILHVKKSTSLETQTLSDVFYSNE